MDDSLISYRATVYMRLITLKNGKIISKDSKSSTLLKYFTNSK